MSFDYSPAPRYKRSYRTFDRVIEEGDRAFVNLTGDTPPPPTQKKRKRVVTVIDFTQDDDENDEALFSPPPRKRQAKTSTCMSCAETKPADAFPIDEQDSETLDALGGSLCRRCWESNFYAEKAHAAQKEKECSICYDTAPAHRFPQAPHGGATDHNVCVGCWEHHLHSEIERKAWDKLTCPQDGCGQVLSYNEITTLDREFEQPIEGILAAQATASLLKQDETYFACPSAACKSGVFVDDQDHGTFSCEACGEQFCFSCKVPMHVGQSCEDYQDSISGNAERRKQEREDEKLVNSKYKTCPNPSCGSKLDLMSGCDHVVCLHCQQRFNWSSVPKPKKLPKSRKQ